MNADVLRRYYCIAGPFSAEEAALLDGATGYLRQTGARIVVMPERHGSSIYRLRSECETIRETTARLRSMGHMRRMRV